MRYNWFENVSPLAKIMLMMVLMICCIFIAFFLALVAAVPFLHKSLTELVMAAGDINSPSNIGFLKYNQVVQSFALFIIPAIILTKFIGEKSSTYLKFTVKPSTVAILITVILIITAIPFINYIEDINSKMKLPSFMAGIEQWMKESEKNAAVLSESFLKSDNSLSLCLNIIIMAILPAFGEEMVFRGIFQRLFSQLFKNVHWGIIVSAALFSALHFQFYGFVPRMLLGVIFGYLLVWSGSLWVPIVAHFINNGIGVVFYYFYYKGSLGNQLQTTGTNANDKTIVLISIISISILLYLFYKFEKKRKNFKNSI